MRLFSLIIIISVLFLLGLLFLRGRPMIKGNLAAYIIPALLIFGIFSVIIGKIIVFFVLLIVSIILLASRMR